MDKETFINDWRNMGQLDYLYKQRLSLVTYTKEMGDHEHCEFCTDKISYISGTINSAYCTVDTKYKYWICQKCYEELRDVFKWSINSFVSDIY